MSNVTSAMKADKFDCGKYEITSYRLMRLLHDCDEFQKMDGVDGFYLCARIIRIQSQYQKGLIPMYTSAQLSTALKLQKILDEEKSIKFVGPINSFIRLKVDDDLVSGVVTQFLDRYVSCIIVDKAEKSNAEVRTLVNKTSRENAQNWIFTDFNAGVNGENGQEEVNGAQFSNDTKTVCLKRRLNNNMEPRFRKKQKIGESIFSCENGSINAYYPTVLELLDIDHPVIREVLIKKCSIDKTLVIPWLDEILLNKNTLHHILPENWAAIGIDQDKNISRIVQCKEDIKQYDVAVVKLVDNIAKLSEAVQDTEIDFWGGPDIRSKWSKFSDNICRKWNKKKVGNTKIPARFAKDTELPALPSDWPGLQAYFSARGSTIQPLPRSYYYYRSSYY